jgi:hypothetical protein
MPGMFERTGISGAFGDLRFALLLPPELEGGGGDIIIELAPFRIPRPELGLYEVYPDYMMGR